MHHYSRTVDTNTRPAVLTQSRGREGPDVANPGLVLPLRPTAQYYTAQTVHEVGRPALMYYRSLRTGMSGVEVSSKAGLESDELCRLGRSHAETD